SVISCLTLSVNIFYGIILFLSWKKKGFRCKKSNVFLASRSYTSVLTIGLLNIALFVWMYGELNFYTTTIFFGLIAADFMFISGTNFAHTVLLYTAVMHPFIYANYLTFAHCIGAGIFLFLLATLQGAIMGFASGTLLFPSSSPVNCTIETFQFPMSFVILF
ncbi:hypothetical protein PFISCL1PPCAC_11103, partial [Pristionchus fissidentatus]